MAVLKRTVRPVRLTDVKKMVNFEHLLFMELVTVITVPANIAGCALIMSERLIRDMIILTAWIRSRFLRPNIRYVDGTAIDESMKLVPAPRRHGPILPIR